MQRQTLKLAVIALCGLFACAQAAFADDPPPPISPNGLAQTPPMGWNSWNKFACNVDETLIRSMADAMVSTGMKAAGYEYVVIDDCWHGERDKDGNIHPDPKRFPSGMKALGDYIHSKGLKFGIYSDAGFKTCAGHPGSWGHEYQDARTYASWGVDYLKYDWCMAGDQNPKAAYYIMAQALRASGRNILLSICEWGNSKPWEWANKGIGNQWRTTGDIMDKWDGIDRWMNGVMVILDKNAELYSYAGPGAWNDPDMLEVGNGGMTETEYRSHFSLWALMASPLIAGNDLRAMDAATKAILINQDVIAINQDKLGVQGRRIAKNGDLEIWMKPLADGAAAVILFNRGPKAAKMSVSWDQLGFAPKTRLRLRDLWAHRDLGKRSGQYEAEVPSHGVVMLRLAP